LQLHRQGEDKGWKKIGRSSSECIFHAFFSQPSTGASLSLRAHTHSGKMSWDDENYESELYARLVSLENYFGDGDVMDIALAGFSGTENPFVVQCENCNACIHEIDEADCLFTLHKLISPDCYLVKHVKLTDNFKNDVDYIDLLDRCKLCCVRCKYNMFHCWPEPASLPPSGPPSSPVAPPTPHDSSSVGRADSSSQELAASTESCSVLPLAFRRTQPLRSAKKSHHTTQ
jgi:Inhibitor of Apoptosis domain